MFALTGDGLAGLHADEYDPIEPWTFNRPDRTIIPLDSNLIIIFGNQWSLAVF